MADPICGPIRLESQQKPVRFTTVVKHTGFMLSVPEGTFTSQ